LNDVRPAVSVEELGAAEVMKERLAVVAITDRAVDRLARGISQKPVNLPTTTLQLYVLAHTSAVI
jgi:hypothetical protein